MPEATQTPKASECETKLGVSVPGSLLEKHEKKHESTKREAEKHDSTKTSSQRTWWWTSTTQITARVAELCFSIPASPRKARVGFRKDPAGGSRQVSRAARPRFAAHTHAICLSRSSRSRPRQESARWRHTSCRITTMFLRSPRHSLSSLPDLRGGEAAALRPRHGRHSTAARRRCPQHSGDAPCRRGSRLWLGCGLTVALTSP